jgi:hypothetical protein
MEQWTLLGVDSRYSRIYILLENENEYAVASASVSMEDTGGVGSWCLAERLSQSLDSSNTIEYQERALRRQQLDSRENGDDGYARLNSTNQGVEMLRLAYDALEEGSLDEGALSSIFTRAIETIAHAEALAPMKIGIDENPQDCHELVKAVGNGKRNGLHQSKVKPRSSAKQSLNGHVEVTISIEPHIGNNLRNLSPSLVNLIGIWTIRFLLTKNRIDTVRNVVRSILREVVRSKKASARQLFDTMGVNSFLVVLRALQRRKDEETSLYSPIELLFDILKHCKDVSERHMVHGAQFILFRAVPDDIIGFFEKMQLGSEINGYKKLCNKIRKVERKSKSDENLSVEKSFSALVLRAGEAFLSAVLTYSDCNETLLRRAISEYLTRREIFTLLKLVSQVRGRPAKNKLNADMLKRAFLWTSVLCESLTSPRSEDELALLNSEKLSIVVERNATKKLLSIRDTLETVIADIQEATGNRTVNKPEVNQNRAQLPPYQLERLVF